MLYGTNKYGIKIAATPSAEAYCDVCLEQMVPKCGSNNVWHWAHMINSFCDNWHEPETQWHLNWKKNFPKNQTEVTLKKISDNVATTHRADAITKKGIILEFQNSSISTEDILARESFYGNMIWIINGEDFLNHLKFRFSSKAFSEPLVDFNLYAWAFCDKWICKSIIDIPFPLLNSLKYLPFYWKFYRRSWHSAKMPLMIDFNNGLLLHIKNIHANGIGYGRIIHKTSILKLAVVDY